MNLIRKKEFCVFAFFAAPRMRGSGFRASLSRFARIVPAPRSKPAKIQNPFFLEKGYSALETVLYIGIFTIITLLTVNTVLALTRAVGEIRTLRHTIHDSHSALERVIREIRASESITTAASIFDTHPGKLVLAGTSSAITFSLLGGEQLFLQKNTEGAIPLTGSSTRVTNLIFTHLTASSSEAVRIRMTMDNKKFYGTAILRTNYK